LIDLSADKWVAWLHVTWATFNSIRAFLHFFLFKLGAYMGCTFTEADRQTDDRYFYRFIVVTPLGMRYGRQRDIK